MSSEVLEMYVTLTDEHREEMNNFIQALVAQQVNGERKIYGGVTDAFGCLLKYANPALWEKEESA